jgi:hypothetical protein
VLAAPTTPIPAVLVEQAMVRLPDKRTGTLLGVAEVYEQASGWGNQNA